MRSVAARVVPALRAWLAPALLSTVLAVLGLIGAISIGWHVLDLPLLDEVGYGDSYILYDVLHLQRTGLVYRDLSQPPYLAAQYSPLVYMLFALANALSWSTNAFVGPRVVVLGAFAACVVLTAAIARSLVPERRAALIAVAVVATILPLWAWVLQIRADFLGIACGLCSICLLLSGRRHAVIAAALFAGLALQFKITFVAAGAAGALWLVGRRQWRSTLVFCLTAVVTAVGPYLLYALREPGMFGQLFTLSPGVPEPAGAVRLLRRAVAEPVLLLALAGLPAVLLDPRWWLVALYAAVAGVIAAATSVQAGANINYYFEPFLAAVPLAVAGWFVVVRQAREAPGVGLLLVFLAALFIVMPRAQQVYGDIRSTPSVGERNEVFAETVRVLGRYRLLSIVPRIALLDQSPPLMEPYLLSYLARMGRAGATPLIVAPLEERAVDAVITPPRRRGYRGIPLIDPALGRAIDANYEPRCMLPNLLVHTPRGGGPATAELVRELEGIGCEPPPSDVAVVP